MRPVDADIIDAQIRAWIGQPGYGDYWTGHDNALCAIQDFIADMPTLTPPNEWVSVEERLPNPKQNVLAYSLSSGVAEADYADGVWMQYRWSAVMDDVTLWRPLPAPPERQGGDADHG